MSDQGSEPVGAAASGDCRGVVQSGVMNILWRGYPNAVQYAELLEQLRVSFPGIEVDLVAFPLLTMLAARHYADVRFDVTEVAKEPVTVTLTKMGLRRWCEFAGTFWAFSTQDPLDPSLTRAPDTRRKSM